MPKPQTFLAAAPIPSIRAEPGDYVLQDGRRIAVLHEHDHAELSPEDWRLLRRVVRRVGGAS